MKILIVEDEENLVTQLKTMLAKILPSFELVATLGSVTETTVFLKNGQGIELIFLDIYLSDGLSFDIFRHLQVDIPIIFTTAYDQYAIQAFEVNSIDYLLKPIRQEALEKAINKYERYAKGNAPNQNDQLIALTTQLLSQKKYKKNFLLPYKDRLLPVSSKDFKYFKISNNLVKGIVNENKFFMMDESLDELVEQLDPAQFYRVNRQFLVSRNAIKDVEYFFNGRLALNILPKPDQQVLVSKAKANGFKKWMNDEGESS